MRRQLVSLAFALLCLVPVAAFAADDPYSVSGIAVDATARSSTEAQNIAINSGRPKAWDVLFRRLVRQEDWAKRPQLDDLGIQRLISTYIPKEERRSTTRYVAKITYVFNPDAVRRLFRSASIAYADMGASKPVLIIPMAPRYAVHGAWTNLFANRNAGSVTFALPVGDVIDASMLGALDFNTASWQDLEPIASRVKAADAYLALATASNGKIVVKLRRLSAGTSPPIPDVVVTNAPGTPGPQAYANAANAAALAIANDWKSRSAVDFGKHNKLVAEVRIESLEQWGGLLQKIGTVQLVTDVGVQAMNIGEARIAIGYAGSLDQLKENLAQAHIDLAQRAGTWWLSQSDDTAATTP
ncbi:MAG: DUF2066 domain-containing protein [Proteobacteria bacterium]|nr:DUF2066 domain-containing protein [Pseudomonadota bacterium]